MGHGAFLGAWESFQKGTLSESLFPDALLEFFSKLRATSEVLPRLPQGSSPLHILKPAIRCSKKLLFSRLTNPDTVKESLFLENLNALAVSLPLSVCSGDSLIDLFLS